MRALLKHGYILERVRGSHHVFQARGKETIVVPIHGNRPLSIGTLQGIVKFQLELSNDEFGKWLHD